MIEVTENKTRRTRKKMIPTLPLSHLLRACLLDISSERYRCKLMGQTFECTKINGHDLDVVIRHNLGMEQSK